jgi:hypothetical protein
VSRNPQHAGDHTLAFLSSDIGHDDTVFTNDKDFGVRYASNFLNPAQLAREAAIGRLFTPITGGCYPSLAGTWGRGIG